MAISEIPPQDQLMERAREGDMEAFGLLCESVETRLYRQAFFLCGDAHTAEDLAQDTLVVAWKSLDRFQGHSQWFTWLCGILIRLHYQMLRRKTPVSFARLSADDGHQAQAILEHAPHPSLPPDQWLKQQERKAALHECLDRLPEQQRQVLHLRFLLDTSLENIAKALHCSLGTVKSRLYYGLRKLAQMAPLQRKE